MRVTCNGNHRLLGPIRPIALTFCDALATARQSRFWAIGLVLAVLGLLLASHLSAEQIEALTGKLIRALVAKYVSGLTTDWIYTGFLHWALANGAFFVFRLGAFFVLYAVYELGRDNVFALLQVSQPLASESCWPPRLPAPSPSAAPPSRKPRA